MNLYDWIRIICPLVIIENIALKLHPFVQPYLENLNNDEFEICDTVFNFLGSILVFKAFPIGEQNGSWFYFCSILMILGIIKRILIMRREQMNEFSNQNMMDQGDTEISKNEPDTETKEVGINALRAEDFCIQNKKPSLDWLNKIISVFWLSHRAIANHIFINSIWPLVKSKLKHTQLSSLRIHDFNIGDKPVSVLNIECFSHCGKALVIDCDVAYDGSASSTITYSQQSLNLNIPVSVRKFSFSNMKVRMVLKDLQGSIPFFGGIQLSLLESPVMNWEYADAAKILDFPGLDGVIKNIIDEHIIRRFITPNRLTLPITLPEKMVSFCHKYNLPVEYGDVNMIALPNPQGVLRVTVMKAEKLQRTDLNFAHFKKYSRHRNPLRPSEFLVSEFLPKIGPGNPYVSISVGAANYQSPTLSSTTDPEWNYLCDFPIEYHHRAQVHLEFINDAANCCNAERSLGKVTEKIERIRDFGTIEGWYNLQTHTGRALLKFQWISLSEKLPENASIEENQKQTGLLCLAIGKLRCEDITRPTVFLELQQEDEEMTRASTLDALSNKTKFVFNEGKIFRISDVKSKTSRLTIRIRDNRSRGWIGERSFTMARLNERDLKGFYLFPNSFTSIKTPALFLCSKMYYDDIS